MKVGWDQKWAVTNLHRVRFSEQLIIWRSLVQAQAGPQQKPQEKSWGFFGDVRKMLYLCNANRYE